MILPFEGIRVLDFSQGVAGSHCGMLFALYGVDVIKVEPPQDQYSPIGIYPTRDGSLAATARREPGPIKPCPTKNITL